MFYPTIGLVLSVAVLAGQTPRPPAHGNYNGLPQITRATVVHELTKVHQPASPKVFGRDVEMKKHGVERGPCGMPIIVVDASVDPKIVIPIPDGVKQGAKIRVAEPALCGATLSNAGRR